MRLLIRGGHVIDPANNIDGICDILVENSKISKVGKDIKAGGARIIDAADKIVMPGIVDMHVHLREPGREDKETVASATKAGLKGGVTSVLAMPNTEPAIDSPQNLRLLKKIIKNTTNANVFICGSITKGRLGKALTDIAELKKTGAVAISDDGFSVDSDVLMLAAFKISQKQKILVICHSEDKSLSAGGVVNLGFISTRLGLRGISCESEYKRVSRDIQLADKAKCPVHIAHISCKESVKIIAAAKRKGIKLTAETCPQYFTLDEDALLSYDTNMKMNPPLRSKDDVAAIKEALKDNTIDCIASDHAPHTESEKEIEFERAEFGTVGVETELALAITELIDTNFITWPDLAKKLCFNPAKILNINKGALGKGSDADIVVIDPDKEWVVTKDALISKSKNSAFLGRRLKGVAEYTILAGEIAYQAK